ncbi:MAG: esterase [Clostridia bacterium]|nr:esterase [Clostridia bacterium]MBO7657882.1 esterase [Clostridia bacterium]MBP5666065.1 esterase [Clostridia bacterium]
MVSLDFGNIYSKYVLVQPVDEYELSTIESEVRLIKELSGKDFMLKAFPVNDWNNDLSPWNAPPVFGKNGFGDGAAKTLDQILQHCGDRSKTYFIGGYSLAGLFSLWAAFQTDLFEGVAAASPSVWFPGFSDFVKANNISCGSVYLSLGDREEQTRNPVMATVGDRIRDIHETLSERGVECVLEMNEGNHFKDADLRTAKAFSWLLRKYPEQ